MSAGSSREHTRKGISSTAVSQSAEGMEKTFNRPAMGEFNIKRETIIAHRLLDLVANVMQEAKRQQALDERFADTSRDRAV